MNKQDIIQDVTFSLEQNNTRNNNNRNEAFCRVLYIFTGICGIMLTFLTAFAYKSNQAAYIFMFMLESLLAYFILKYDNKYFKYIKVIVLAVVMISVFIYMKSIKWGFLYITGIEKAEISEMKSYCNVFIIFISILVTIIISVIHRMKLKWLNCSILVIPVIILLLMGYKPSAFSYIFIFITIAGYDLLDNTSIKNSDSTAISLMVSTGIFVAAVLVIFIYPEWRFKENNPIYKVSDSIISLVQKEENVNVAENAVGGIGGGEIGSVDKLEYKNISMMTLKTGFTDSLYLKAFIGSIYKDNSWQPLDDDTKEKYNELYRRMKDNSVNPYNLLNSLLGIVENDEELINEFPCKSQYVKDVLHREVSIYYNYSDKKYWYIPYSCDLVLQDMFEDTYPVDNEIKQINSKCFSIIDCDYDSINKFVQEYTGDNSKVQQYRIIENQYKEYVKDNYLYTDDNVNEVIKKLDIPLPQYNKSELTKDKLEYCEKLKDYFNNNYTYTLNPGRVPEGRDSFEYFMTQSKQGYCIYFASAATLILRNQGIPARYVEGYSVTPNISNVIDKKSINFLRKSKALNVNERFMQYQIDVKDSNAHAWTEIYADGVGWIPIDVTPSDYRQIVEGYEEDEKPNQSVSEDATVAETLPDNSGVNMDDISEEELLEYIAENERKERESNAAQYICTLQYIVDNKEGFFDKGTLKIVAYRDLEFIKRTIYKLAILLLLLVAAFYIPARVVEKRRDKLLIFNKSLETKEKEIQLINIYRYIVRIGHYLKCDRLDSMTYSEWAKQLAAKSEAFKNNDIESIINTVIKLTFSNKEISDDELEMVINNVRSIRKDSYPKTKKLKKIVYRFLLKLK